MKWFKPGDKVKCINSKWLYYYQGILIVESNPYSTRDTTIVRRSHDFTSLFSCHLHAQSDNFELVSDSDIEYEDSPEFC